jgi:hypothetical protein
VALSIGIGNRQYPQSGQGDGSRVEFTAASLSLSSADNIKNTPGASAGQRCVGPSGRVAGLRSQILGASFYIRSIEFKERREFSRVTPH